MNPEVQQLLLQHWKVKTFRPGQKEAVAAVLDKRDALVVLPTGGGKSLCYQLPGLYLPGLCVVISPLIALMNDQVTALKNKGIRAMHIAGPMSENELITALDNCRFGGFDFLYLSPERAQHPLVLERLAEMKLSLLAIDEAHCISEWGHDFRPAYRELVKLKDTVEQVPVMATTATATTQVQDDICTNLDLQNPRRIVGSFDRSNIRLNVLFETNKLEAIADALCPINTPTIVYVATRKNAESLSHNLNKMGHKTAYFHGGAADKEKRIKQWMQEKIPVMVATTAFGMGIDKDNVGRVIHASMPYSIEQYYQEIGRCGRDGNTAEATLLVEQADSKKLYDRLMSTIPTEEVIKKTYKHLCHYFDIAYGERPNQLKEFNLNLFCVQYGLIPKTTHHVLEILERGQVLTNTQYKKPKTKVYFSKQQKQGTNPLSDYLLRHVGGITARFQYIDLDDIARRSSISIKECLKELKVMEKNGMVEIEQLHVDNAIEFHLPREDQRTLLPIIRQLAQVADEKKRLAAAVWAYCQSKSCLRKQLLSYFGEQSVKNCGNCSRCVNSEENRVELSSHIMELLSSEETLSLDQIKETFSCSNAAAIEALDLLIQEEIIEQVSRNIFTRK
jgi:ATP-dependent DNA helicase RecQ